MHHGQTKQYRTLTTTNQCALTVDASHQIKVLHNLGSRAENRQNLNHIRPDFVSDQEKSETYSLACFGGLQAGRSVHRCAHFATFGYGPKSSFAPLAPQMATMEATLRSATVKRLPMRYSFPSRDAS